MTAVDSSTSHPSTLGPKECYELGSKYLFGDTNTKIDEKKALYYYDLAARQNYAKAHVGVGNCYLLGAGIEKNLKKAVECFQKAAQQNVKESFYSLGVCFEYGGSGIDIDEKKALEYYKIAADVKTHNYAHAQYKMARCYHLKRLGLKKDEKKAFEYYKLAASQNHKKAQYNLGVYYDDGGFIHSSMYEIDELDEKGKNSRKMMKSLTLERRRQDVSRYKEEMKLSLEYYTLAANQDYVPAIVNLGVAYFQGIKDVLAKDIQKASLYFRHVLHLENTHKLALYNLGLCYEISKDYGNALICYSKCKETKRIDKILKRYPEYFVHTCERNLELEKHVSDLESQLDDLKKKPSGHVQTIVDNNKNSGEYQSQLQSVPNKQQKLLLPPLLIASSRLSNPCSAAASTNMNPLSASPEADRTLLRSAQESHINSTTFTASPTLAAATTTTTTPSSVLSQSLPSLASPSPTNQATSLLPRITSSFPNLNDSSSVSNQILPTSSLKDDIRNAPPPLIVRSSSSLFKK
jgi:TPR repeat protein